MSFAVSTLLSPTPSSLKPPHFPLHLSSPTRNHVIPFRSTSIRTQSFVPEFTRNSLRFPPSNLGFSIGRRRRFRASVEKGEGGGGERERVVDKAKEEEDEGQEQRMMPDQFRPLMEEVPETPVRWPLFVGLAVLLYAWRTVLWELSNWKKAAASIVQFVGYLLKLALALVFHFIGDPITSLIRGLETTIYTFQAFYSAVVSDTPVPELTLIIILVSSVLAIAEAAVPDSVESQHHLLTVAGILGFAAVRGFTSEFSWAAAMKGYFPELAWWTSLFGLFAFAWFVKKRDYVSSVLPVAAILAAVGEPWVRVAVMISYLALAITHHSKRQSEDEDGGEAAVQGRKVPVPLFCAALAIGIRVAANWLGYRHLTWMII